MPSFREVSAESLGFDPAGSHGDGTAIAAATVLAIPTGAGKLMIQALTQNVRYTLDGTTPTATTGFQLKAGDPPIILALGNGTIVTVIEETATADIQYQFGR